MTDTTQSHAALMDSTYRHQRWIYDITRRYFLLGRDRMIARLDPPPQARVLEIACGTGRNLDLIGRRYRDANLYGFDISAQMLASAEARLHGRATLARGDACTFDAEVLFGIERFDRVILSYSLSMIPDWTAAIERALAHVAPGGELHIVDFGDQRGLPAWFRTSLVAWLGRFHVTLRDDLRERLSIAAARPDATVRFVPLYRGFASHAVVTAPGRQEIRQPE